MAKTTFYFVVAALVIVDMMQGRYQKKIMVEEKPLRRLRRHCPFAGPPLNPAA